MKLRITVDVNHPILALLTDDEKTTVLSSWIPQILGLQESQAPAAAPARATRVGIGKWRPNANVRLRKGRVAYITRKRTDITTERVLALRKEGKTDAEICAELKCSSFTIYDRLKGLKPSERNGRGSNGSKAVPNNKRWHVSPEDARKAGLTK
jgi:hypothetical protein